MEDNSHNKLCGEVYLPALGIGPWVAQTGHRP